MTEARPNRSGQATRARIVQAAIGVMAEKGFAGITMQAVATAAGIHYGNLTHHYASREKLIDALLSTLLERYRAQFRELATAIASNRTTSLSEIVTWLLDDAVAVKTGPVFLELWAMATHEPAIADAMASLYDEAVKACIEAFGVSQDAAARSGLRDSLYLLGTIIEGSSAIFSARPTDTEIYGGFRREALALLTDTLGARLATARQLDGHG